MLKRPQPSPPARPIAESSPACPEFRTESDTSQVAAEAAAAPSEPAASDVSAEAAAATQQEATQQEEQQVTLQRAVSLLQH